ncbi:MAG TPA: class I SAM-dependent methyltransferase [Azospirillum sp.]|nr:class I SAM-dependent methyltransferase [Azospirillum sp.]
MQRNDDLKKIYDQAYAGGKSYASDAGSFFTFPTDDVTRFVIENVEFSGKTVLEVGCGTGDTAAAIARVGAARVLAIDYADEAIKGCRSRHQASNLTFEVQDFHMLEGTFDVVLLQEVIEHLDDPEQAIVDLMERVAPGGKLVVTCPNFTNLRGYVWMTLQVLLQVPMSLTDLHFLSPFDFEQIARTHDLSLEWATFGHDRVYSEKLIVDMRKRLTNALRDAKLDNSRVPQFMDWLSQVLTIDNQETRFNGGKGFYVFSRPQAGH